MNIREKSINAILAPLVRGLGVNAVKEALTVVPGPAEKIPGAIYADIDRAITDGLIDEEAAAAILCGAAKEAGDKLPSCVVPL